MEPALTEESQPTGNLLLLRGAALWLIMALILAWCLVGLAFGVPELKEIFRGKYSRLLQAHLDFLLMTALILGISATKVPLPWHVRWAMVVGAFTNSSCFLLQALFPELDGGNPTDGVEITFLSYLMTSLVVTSYGFGRAAALLFLSTFTSPIPK
jgi:hypothetical protein